MKSRDDIRNIAIIAHVDHGKTTLVNEMLKQSDTLPEHFSIEDRAMDTNAIERERGITILSKNTAVKYGKYQINILDTPGHADFGGEVERVMKMVDGVLLVVDAFEGTMPQTRFVLKKALEQHLTPIVVINKVDRKGARPEEVVDEVLDLFIELGADEDQLDFPVVYTSAMNGTSSYDSDISTQEHTMKPLFDTIIKTIPAPIDNSDEPLQFQVAILDYNDFVGRIGIGRVFRGKIKVGDNVTLMKLDGSKKNFRVTKLFGFFGLKRLEIKEAEAGDLIAVSGMEDINVGETVTDPEHPEAITPLRIDPPTLRMTFRTNDSPFAGREGKFVTARQLEDRLKREMQTDVSLKVEDTDDPGAWTVSGRGELHLSVLIENMRREGYELAVSRPKVIYREINGKKQEPYEQVTIDVEEQHQGSVMEALGIRKGEVRDMMPDGKGRVRLEYIIPSRGLIGFRGEFMTMTSGTGLLYSSFDHYDDIKPGEIGQRKNGVLISNATGKALAYALFGLQERGKLMIEANVEVYEGQIIGIHSRTNDLTVNCLQGKKLTNMRASGKDDAIVLTTPVKFTLEQAIEFIDDDELVEVTPESIRIRKKLLTENDRKRANRTTTSTSTH